MGVQLFMHYPDRQLPARVRVFVEFVARRMRSHPELDTDPVQFAAASPRRGVPVETSVAIAGKPPAEASGRAKAMRARAKMLAALTSASKAPQVVPKRDRG